MSAITTLPGFSLYSAFTATAQGRMEFPVSPSQAIYAQFRYVEGVPSEQGGVPLDRLRILDSLIAEINAHRASGTPPLHLEAGHLANPEAAIAELAHKASEMQKSSDVFHSWTSSKALVINLSA